MSGLRVASAKGRSAVWRVADLGVGCVAGLILAGLSYGFMDVWPLWFHGAAGLAGLGGVVLFAPLSSTM